MRSVESRAHTAWGSARPMVVTVASVLRRIFAGRGAPSPRRGAKTPHSRTDRRRRWWTAAAVTALAVGVAACTGPGAVRLETAVGGAVTADSANGGMGAVVPPADPQPYPTPIAPADYSAPTQGQIDRLHALLQPWLAAQQVDLPSDTPAPVAEPSAGWLPSHRIVAYYGNPLSAGMGVLAWYPPEVMMAHLQAQADAYAQVDPGHPVVPAVDLVADVAQGSPGAHGAYRLRMPYSMIGDELALARRHHAILILDVQVGRSTVADEVPYFLPYLSQPDVMLALDPEFDMPPGEVPGRWIGTMSASEINWAVQYVSDLVTRLHLPPKIVIVHQFTPGMVPDWRGIHLAPGVQFVMDTDGYGGQGIKHANYQQYIADQPVPPVRYGGIKLFYKYDVNLMTPAEVVALQPPPSLVVYQ